MASVSDFGPDFVSDMSASESGGSDIGEVTGSYIDENSDINESSDIGEDTDIPKDGEDTGIPEDGEDTGIPEDGEYTSKEDVALYIHTYGKLPSNFITKSEARELGWDSSENTVGDVAPGKSIGGDTFGNREGLLPEADNRTYYECDIDYTGGSRGAKRIVFSNDGLIFYTDDHYSSFEQLY